MNCPKCNQPMENLGNVEGVIMTSYPEQWYDTHICRICKVKTRVLVRGRIIGDPDLSDYEEIET